MSSFDKMELAIAQLVHLIESELPGELDVIVHERNDLIDLPHPVQVMTALENVNEYPVVLVLPAQSAPQIDTGFAMIAEHVVHLEAFLSNTDAPELNTQILRYITAIKRVVLRTRTVTLNGAQTAFSATWIGDEYGEGFALKGDEEVTINSVAARFQLTSDEQ